MPDLTPSQVSGRSGVAVSALHYYEKERLIHATRTGGNQRRYTPDTLRRLAFIGAAQRVGVPLAQIREALHTLPDGRTPTAKDWAQLSAMWREELNERIATLERLRDDLSGCISCGCLSLEKCRLYNPDDEYAQKHPQGNTLTHLVR